MLHAMPRVVLLGGSLAAAGLLLGAAVKPEIDDRSSAVTHDWSPVAAKVDRRAQALVALDTLLAARGAPQLAVSGAAARAGWTHAASATTSVQIAAGNGVESATARALALAAAPPYASDPAIVRTARELRAAAPDEAAVAALDRAVASENAIGNNPLRRLVAGLSGHDDVPAFIVAT